MTKSKREYVNITHGCTDARDLTFKYVPDHVAVCPVCHGNGKYRQWYIEGTMTGPCDFCSVSGFVYRNTSNGVPISVTNQIAVANGYSFRRFQMYGIDWNREMEATTC